MRSLMRSLLALTVASALSGCWEEVALGPEGFRCDAAHPCADGLACLGAVCTRELATPFRAAFFVGAFPYLWGPSLDHSRYEPDLGKYSSDAVRSQHLAALAYGNIDVGVFSWFGAGKDTDVEFNRMLDASAGSAVRWAVLFEREALDHPDAETLRFQLNDLRLKFLGRPNYLTQRGLPVVFVRASYQAELCEVASRWAMANGTGASALAYLVVVEWSDQNPSTCAKQPDAWLSYTTSVARSSTPTAFLLTPGVWIWEEAGARLARDPARWRTDVEAMVASGAPLQVVNSFNAWNEGSSVEGSPSWSSPSGYGVYLDALHEVPTPR